MKTYLNRSNKDDYLIYRIEIVLKYHPARDIEKMNKGIRKNDATI